jgi:hypothetical protein
MPTFRGSCRKVVSHGLVRGLGASQISLVIDKLYSESYKWKKLIQAQRVAEFLRRLGEARPAASHDEAFNLVRDTLNAVEDRFSGVAFDPDKHLTDGRLYPPQQDSRRSLPGRDDVVRYRSRGHNTLIAANGAIRIEKIGKGGELSVCCLDKRGADGKTVEL